MDKMPLWMIHKPSDYQTYFNTQLKRCGQEYFDYYWFHTLGLASAKDSKKLGGFAFLKKMKAEGKAKHIGFSFHDTADALDEILTTHPEIEYVQLIVNYIDWTNGGLETRKCYETAVRHNRKVVVMEPLKGGVLANVPLEIESMYREYDA